MKFTSVRLSIATLGLLALCVFQSGCAMCCGPYDYAYGGSGGTFERNDLFNGRVGSPFSDPNANQEVELIDPNGDHEMLDDSQIETL